MRRPTIIGIGASMISMSDLGRIGIDTWHHFNGYRNYCMPNTEEDNKLRLSDTNIIDFSKKRAVSI